MKRYTALDEIRGFAIFNMIIYHGIWDLVYIFDVEWKWYSTVWSYVWQQGICWTFILLSGFCWSLGRKKWQGGVKVFLSGTLVTLVTFLIAPGNRVVFGILTLLGSCQLLMIFLDKWLKKWNPVMGLCVSFCLFVIFRGSNNGYLGFAKWKMIDLPTEWYQNQFTAYLGFPGEDFYSTDYFSLVPWMFHFFSGYFLYKLVVRLSDKKEEGNTILDALKHEKLSKVAWVGRHSLIIYLLHQPILYLFLSMFFYKS